MSKSQQTSDNPQTGNSSLGFVSGSFLSKKVKTFCKNYKLKLEQYTKYGFIASQLVDVKAGMEFMPGTGKLISIPIRKIGTKRVFTSFICYSDGDIVGNGTLNYR